MQTTGTVPWPGDIGPVLFTEAQIQQRVAELGAQISQDYAGKDLIVVGVLKGVLFFLADLLRAITIPVRLAVGDRDATVSIDECVEGRALLAQGELEVFPATAHPLERVSLPRLGRSVIDFLA